MNAIVLHDSFVADGCAGMTPPLPAVSIGPGAIWAQAYDAVATKGGRYVQGGGCLTVGVAGLVQAGGFGSFSKQFGTAAASLIEAEIVTADGVVRIANACANPDLLWGLKGGGGGSLGVVTRMTLKMHDLPALIGGVRGTIAATSDAAYRRLIAKFIAFYATTSSTRIGARSSRYGLAIGWRSGCRSRVSISRGQRRFGDHSPTGWSPTCPATSRTG